MNIRYRVDLTADERDELGRLLSGGRCAARRLKRAQILLAANDGVSDQEIERTIGASGSTIYRTKRRLVEYGLEAALSEEPRPGAGRKLTGKQEALLVATACAKPPAGRARWTLELLAGEMIKLTDHDELSRETVRRRLLENDLKPWRKDMWCIPEVDAEYVARMEDVLDLYNEEPDPKHPVVCFDESPTQLIGEARLPIPATPGQLERFDCEYRRNGTANLFVFLDAHRSWRRAKVTDRRAAQDFAGCMRDFVRSVQTRNSALSPTVDTLGRRDLPDLSRPGGQAHSAPHRVPLHPKARKLAQHGGDRDRRAAQPVSRSPHRQPSPSCLRGRRLGAAAQQLQCVHKLDVHRGKSPRQNGPCLSNPDQ